MFLRHTNLLVHLKTLCYLLQLHPHIVCQSLEKICKVHILNAPDHGVFNKISLYVLVS